MEPDERIWPLVREKLERAGNDLMRLSLPVQTVALVTTAQGIIDKGGFKSFFGTELPNAPPYAAFIAAYRRVGAIDVAGYLERSANAFPFRNPHRYGSWRKKFLSSLDEDSEFYLFQDLVRGNRGVWILLWKYIELHKEFFASG